jgi:hypothetical protein
MSPSKTPEELVVEADETVRLHRAIRELDDRTARIIRLRFGFVDGKPRTLNQIADELGLTESRICQIEAKTLRTLARRLEPQMPSLRGHEIALRRLARSRGSRSSYLEDSSALGGGAFPSQQIEDLRWGHP